MAVVVGPLDDTWQGLGSREGVRSLAALTACTCTHTCTVQYMYCTCTVHVQYMYSTCTVHVLYCTCTVHVLYMYSTCTVHVQYMYCTYCEKRQCQKVYIIIIINGLDLLKWLLSSTVYVNMWWVGLKFNCNFQENEASYDCRFCYAIT